MPNLRKLELQRAVIELEKPYPKDDLIVSYADFLKVRNYLGNYQFNPIVLENLVRIANELWRTEKRINRISLLEKIKLYYFITQQEEILGMYIRSTKPAYSITLETRTQLFSLFRKTFEESDFISPNQLNEARKICNNILINIGLTPNEEEWLCSNVSTSEMILNRTLRYPLFSKTISSWAIENFNNDLYRSRRSELISWKIDVEPKFEIDSQTLIDDFEYLNQCDINALKVFEDNSLIQKYADLGLGQLLPKQETTYGDIQIPALKLSQRPYIYPIDYSKNYPVKVPDFDAMRRSFYNELSIHLKNTMIWAIGYSRLDNKQKCSLLKKYYCEDTYYAMYKVGVRINNTQLLKWMVDVV